MLRRGLTCPHKRGIVNFGVSIVPHRKIGNTTTEEDRCGREIEHLAGGLPSVQEYIAACWALGNCNRVTGTDPIGLK